MENRTSVQIMETQKVKAQAQYVVVGVPEAGLVGLIACSYLMQRMKLPEIGYIDSDQLPQVIIVHDSEPKSPIRIFGGAGLVVVLSEIPLTSRFSYEFAKEIVGWAKSKGSRMILGLTGVPSNKRLESDEDAKPAVFGVSNSREVMAAFMQKGVQPFEEGMISGTHAALMKQCMASNLPNVTLLVESYPEFPDPSAAASSVEILNSVLSINVDIKPLMEESEQIRLKTRDLMRMTQQSTRQPTEVPGLYA